MTEKESTDSFFKFLDLWVQLPPETSDTELSDLTYLIPKVEKYLDNLQVRLNLLTGRLSSTKVESPSLQKDWKDDVFVEEGPGYSWKVMFCPNGPYLTNFGKWITEDDWIKDNTCDFPSEEAAVLGLKNAKEPSDSLMCPINGE
jgi:hypothetical protein